MTGGRLAAPSDAPSSAALRELLDSSDRRSPGGSLGRPVVSGPDDDDELIESPDNSSGRPPQDHLWLIVHFELTCRSTGLKTGGCNVQGGQVAADGERANGSNLNGLVDYDATEEFWAAYPVPVNAGEVIVEIFDGGNLAEEAKTSFVVDDLAPLTTMATPPA